MIRVKNIFFVLVAMSLLLAGVSNSSAQDFCSPSFVNQSTCGTPAMINFDAQCALQAAQTFSSCRASGGGRFGCLFSAGVGYWQCSGSSFETLYGIRRNARQPGRLRTVFIGARAVLRGR